MKRLAAFLTRLLVFSMLAVVQRLIFDASPDPLRESFNRMVVGSCQVLIIFSVYLLVQICRWIFNVINAQGTYNNVSTNNLECDEILRHGDALSMHAETASVLSTGLIANKVIIFANRDALSQHVMRVYFTGFLLWCTSSYCFSYMESQVLLWVTRACISLGRGSTVPCEFCHFAIIADRTESCSSANGLVVLLC